MIANRKQVIRSIVLVAIASGASLFAPASEADELAETRSIKDPAIDESSGLAASRTRPGWYWTHNDSGDQPRLFAVSPMNDETCRAVQCRNAEASDWEDMAAGKLHGRSVLVVGDVGDNGRRRESIQLYIGEEPSDDVAEIEMQRLEVVYQDGPRDCEAIAIDESTGRVLLIEKGRLPVAGVYAVEVPTSIWEQERRESSAPLVAKRLCTIHFPMITGIDISRDGRSMAVVTYFDLFVYQRQQDETWEQALVKLPQRFALPKFPQTEAVAFAEDGSIWVTSERSPMLLGPVDMQPSESGELSEP